MPGRGMDAGRDEEAVLGDLLDAADALITTLETMPASPVMTFASLQIQGTTVLYDEEGSYAAIEIQTVLSVTRI
jgi:hypothetical protein